MENRRTAGEAPEGAANNQYLSLADRLESAAVIRQQTTINKALMSNPEIEAEKRRLAGQLNLPAVAIDGLGMDEAKRRSALQQVQQNAANAPVLGRSLARDNFARLAIDDTSPLARIETALKDPVFRQGRAILEAQQRAIGGTLDAFRALQRPGALLKSLLAGTADLAAAAPGVARAGLEVAESYSRSAMPLIFSEKLTPEQIAQIRGERISAEKPFDPNAPLAVAAETARAGQEALRATGTRLMPTARTKGEEMVFGGVRSAGSSLGALLAGALTRSPGLAMEIMGSTAGAESYARGREKGLEPIEAAVYGWTSRNIEKVTELIPVKGLIDNLDAKTPLGTMLLDQLAREIPTEQAATVLGDLNDWVMTNPEGTLQEYLAERPSRALETLVSTVVATGLQTTIVKGADMARESLIQRVQQEKEVNQITTEGQLAVVEALMGEAANSKLAARDRDELQAFVDEAAADSPVTSIYIAPETLAQTAMDLNLDVRVVAEQLGVADQLMSSAQTGADIQLSVGAFIAKVSGTDLAAPLMNVIKTDPFLYSRAEMAQLKETGYANEVAEAEELVRTVLTDESFRASADVVRSQVTEQLQAMGRFTGDINTVYASATAQAYLTLAKRLNITPEEALARAPLKIRGQTITGQTPGVLQQPEVTLEQAQTQGYAGQDIGEAQEWVRARAKGLDMSQPARMERAKAMGFDTETVLYHGTGADFTEFKPSTFGHFGPGIYLTDSPRTASAFGGGEAKSIMPVYVAGKIATERTHDFFLEDAFRETTNEPRAYEIAAERMQKKGYAGFKVPPIENYSDSSTVILFNSSNIRSVNAAFDPDESASANILAQAQASGYEGSDTGEAQEWVRARNKGLNMSQEARMQRAQEMGFNAGKIWYHGAVVWPTTKGPNQTALGDITAFDRMASTRTRKPSSDTLGVFLSDNPGEAGAGMYAGPGINMDQPLRPSPVVYPLVVRANNTYSTTFDEMLAKAAQLNNERGRPTSMEPYREWLKSQGFDSVSIAKEPGEFADQNVLVVLDEANIRSVNAAFDPDESASANILAQEARSTLETNPAAFGLTPEQIKKVNPIYNPKTLPVERLPSNQEAALWLEGNYIGDPVTDLTAELSDEQIKEIATIMAAEAQLALGNTGNAFTWYSSALAKALDIISIKYPMLADDAAAAEAGLGTSRNARFAFTYIMAVTSQNLDVAANSVATDKAFGEMLQRVRDGNFTMPRSWGTGDKQKAMGENFAKFGPLIDKMPGDDFPSKLAALDDLFRVKMTVKEWVAYMKQQGVPYNKPGQTAMDAVVYGSSLLGPKIGNGFWQNLNGNYDPMTIDLWMRRTWGRLTGKSIGNPAALPEQRARLAGAIKRSRSREQGKPDHIAAMAAKIAATEKQLNGLKQADFASKKEFTAEEKRLKAEIKDNQEALADLANLKAPETWSAEYNTSNDALLAYAKRLLKAWNVEYERLKEGSKSGTVPAEAQPTWARAAKTIITNLAKPLDQVANGTQRKQIERAGKEALRILQERGITLTTADLQAILWYPEKELWGSLTAELETDEDGDPVVPPSSLNESYDTAFSRILKEQGYEIQGIAGDGGGGLGAGAVARQDGGPQQPASSGRVGAPGGAIAERGPDTLGQAKRNLDALGFYSAVQEAAKLIPDNVWKMGWPAARSALAKGGAGIAPRKTELQYLNLDAMFGDTKLKGTALKDAVMEHIAAKRLSLVENFARFDPNVKVPTKAAMLEQMDDDTLANMLGVSELPSGAVGEGRIIAFELDGANEFNTGLSLKLNKEQSNEYSNQYDLYRGLNLPGQREVIATDVIGNLLGTAARIILDENRNLVMRKISAETMRDYWEGSRTTESAGLVRGPGDIRLPGEDVPLFEAVIGLPKGVPGADYRAPMSHVGGKAKGTLVTAHGEERVDDKGQRTIFVGQVQSDMAQGKREEKKDLEASAKALRVLENNPNANLFLYTGGQIRVASAEDAADVPYAATLLSRDQVKEMYKTEGARIETPLITTSEWTNVAVRAMIYRAAREGFESISFPTGETSAIIQGNDAAAQHYETNVKGALEKLAKQLGEEVRKGGVATNLDDVAEVNARAEEERLIQQTAENMGIPEEEFANFRKELIEEGQFYDRALSEERAKAQMASAYILDLTPAMREKIMSEGFPLFQERRGEYAPALNEIRINAQADLSTYIHELGHHFLEVYNNVALELVASQVGGQDLAEQEQVLVDDTRRLITEIARQTNTPIDGDALTWWNGLTFQQRVPMHEQFARLTEAYFMAGEAPTPELKDIFSTIRRWMLQVYKSLTELNVELSDEVKEVMGRMYAAQDDIATAERNRGLNRLFSVKPDYMSDQEWQAYQQIAAQATSDAEDELSARSVRDVQWLASARSRELRKLQRANADKRNLMKAEVSLEVMQMPVNRARSFLKRGVGPNDEPVTGPHKLSIAIMESRYPQQADTDPARRWKRLGYGQYGMLAETGLDPDTVAELTGFPSGDALVEALLTAERASTVIDAETDRRMLERYGDLSDEQKMSQAADEAVHNGLRARVLQAEYAALSKAAKRTRPLVMAAKEIAQAQVAKMQASKLNANKFIAAERAAGKKAEAALRKSDLTGAATAKRDQLLNFEIAREIQRVIKQRDRMLTLFKTIVTAKRDTVSKTRNYDLVQASRAVLSAYGFGRVKNDVNSYLEAIKVYDPTLYSNLAPTITNAVSRGMTMDQLSVEQFLGMGDVVKQLWDLSREEMVVEIDGRKLELAAVTQELGLKLESLGAAPKGASTEAASDWQKTLRQGEGLKSSLRRVEAWARLYDGTKVGPFTKYIWRTISTAADRYRADRNKYVQQFRDLFATIEGGMGGKKINAPEINYTFRTKSELLHAILHTGNGSNKRKLLLGRQWGEVDQDGALIDNRWQNLINRLAQEGVLTKADFDFAQGVWDLLEETKPLAQETHRKVFGLYFSEITAEEVQTPFGTYRGGYVPAVYDSYNVQDAALRAQQEQVEANDSTMFPAPASGFTKNRVEYNRELALDLMILPNHIDKVLKFSHMASPVRDVMKILKNKEFSALLEAIDPTAQSDVLLPWLTRAARQIVEEPTKGQGGPMVDGFFRAIRQRSGMGLMFANLVNVAQQVTGFSLAAIVVKPSYLARGLLRYTSNPQKITETIRQASMMMRERGDNQLSAMYGEIDKIIDKDDKYGQVKDWFGRHTYFMQQGVQNVMDVIVWLGAYDQALAAGETENEAAKQGDAAVRMTQGSTLPEDVSRIETGPAVLRSFTHMYSYFNMWGNLLSAEFRTTWRELGLKQGAGRLMFAYMAGLAIPTFFAQIIADGLRGKLPEDEDEDGWMDEWLSWAFMTSSKTALAFIPVAGQAGVATIGAFTNEPYDDRVGGSPAISAVEASVRTPASVYKAIAEDGDKSRAVKDTLTLLTTLTGLPFQVLGRPVGYAVDVAEGDITPTSGADYVRGLVTGAASEASR
jgi:hypothetical protein